MRTPRSPKYLWTDEQLIAAVRDSACWRDVVRALGIPTNSEGTMVRVKRDVAGLGLDVSHFKGTRTWGDAQLERAVAEAMCWDDVFTSLGLRTPTKKTRTRVEGHAIRLGLDLARLNSSSKRAPQARTWQLDPKRLRDAATPLAAAWFTMRGGIVSLPVEQAVYDLLVQSSATFLRVQVKTTTVRAAGGTVNVARRPYFAQNLGPRLPYDPNDIDYFFIVDGDYNIYLIPSRVIAGRVGITLRAYKTYIVGNAAGSLGAARTAAPESVVSRSA
jgi:hypothetical protein